MVNVALNFGVIDVPASTAPDACPPLFAMETVGFVYVAGIAFCTNILIISSRDFPAGIVELLAIPRPVTPLTLISSCVRAFV